ncbi:phosphopantothenoylcysteine decarboxylase / phosphopantothenate--cysteine ligase [Andreprevotia lacus DSM 23236]|jgi:phosphopantothenoylcysteine decarboxylase/phosphopantothenate--cysteine ligase|uniref:Coenzyme A biosynthesis bifunctional protein CoaBC n=1 Tax=Andreprevotia lacus DSM 23236 TaxID=1121001 RepID=A0A1W1XWU8_9NEIS|nr:bifunctional phosphopantothenoylcysteine decarboxylase/phosphopantothenate--cysteine ligase CoaBC [Andreprevotia lacus]SMC28314.1 phosphopantothenoylcysteine decarboxylase / phosphopantothenate--cysteine ligase [Andreprevotia lacus DSM 23236]
MKQRRIVLGVTGGVAAYKSAELVRLMVKAGWLVDVVLTEAGAQFVGPATFQALSNRPVYTQLWSPDVSNGMAHIQLTRGADALLVAPATADIIAKTAHGLTDDLLSTLISARDCPLLIAPAMNRQMWGNPPNQRNIAQLRADGVSILGPAAGEQACGEVGEGRMLEPEELMQHLEASFQPKPLAGRRVLLTAGPTFERIDAVRGITNSSSGKMGFAIARAAWEAGAEVVIVAGETAQATPPGCRRINVLSAQEMLTAVEQEVDDADIFIAVAAVADYYVLNPSEQKIKKDAHILTLELAPNPDILARIATRPQPPFCVGFAAESENLLEYAEAKRKRKHLPLLAANLVQQAMGADDNEVILLDDNGEHRLPRGLKLDVARKLIGHVAQLYVHGKTR